MTNLKTFMNFKECYHFLKCSLIFRTPYKNVCHFSKNRGEKIKKEKMKREKRKPSKKGKKEKQVRSFWKLPKPGLGRAITRARRF